MKEVITAGNLFLIQAEINQFGIKSIKLILIQLYTSSQYQKNKENLDLIIFHQNKDFILQCVRRKVQNQLYS